jgi:hypothetical protein
MKSIFVENYVGKLWSCVHGSRNILEAKMQIVIKAAITTHVKTHRF